ncbi:MAG: prepilin-type N-terminal cleavage/methylation domain-containing protein [Methylococcales bacterium]|nr:prepilin-type N-terminal cleavage/methylation domain-containing protein [Methylococcales bacterium]
MEQNKQSGFSLLELVMVLVILGVLSATAIPKLSEKSVYAESAFFDDVLHGVQYAQKLAVATGCGVRFSISSNRYQITRRGVSGSTACPTSGSIYSLAAPHPGSVKNDCGVSGTFTTDYWGCEDGVTLSAINSVTGASVSSINFYAKGDASINATITVASKTMILVKETGFIYAP